MKMSMKYRIGCRQDCREGCVSVRGLWVPIRKMMHNFSEMICFSSAAICFLLVGNDPFLPGSDLFPFGTDVGYVSVRWRYGSVWK